MEEKLFPLPQALRDGRGCGKSIGERAYLGLYTLAALATLGWMIYAYGKAPIEPLWPGLRLLPVVAMPIAFILLVCGVLSRNPTAVGQEKAFGVLAFVLTRAKRAFADWDIRLAQQFADLAAIAILNARLYETAQQRGEGLESRLQELERYAADMAHDLKGPARRMAELASLLQMDYKGRFDERADRYLAWIRDNGQQLMARIEEVLRLARIGAAPETIEPVDPAEVARDVLKGCAEHLERGNFAVQVAGRFPRVACNRVHLFQVLDNLVRNAVKFSAKGRAPVLEIGVQGAGREAALFVRDNGIGIPPADRERIFEPFERLGQKEAPGTGIGLAIVKKIIELYQGRVWVETEPGEGATFFFTLPMMGELATAEAGQEREGV
jgi:signal transduction histidine kinase